MKFTLMFAIFFCQISFAQQEVGQRSVDISKSRADLEGLLDKRSYSEEEHKTIKSYFNALNSFEKDLSDYPRYRNRFNNYLRSVKVENFCASVLLDAARWKSLVKNCTKNDFFLCSDDVMTFSDAKKKLSEMLDTDLKTEFEKSQKCK